MEKEEVLQAKCRRLIESISLSLEPDEAKQEARLFGKNPTGILEG